MSNKKTLVFSVRLTPELHQRIKALAIKERRSIGAVIRAQIERQFDSCSVDVDAGQTACGHAISIKNMPVNMRFCAFCGRPLK